ncbi:HAD family hydrolase [Pseudoclavibacter helvolus]|uniref:HAD family hydrolase n=1 Tax=Pseudoclavibacter helvolus TaxID=255205 RepID=UPI003C783EEB
MSGDGLNRVDAADAAGGRMLVALDIDGTILGIDGAIPEATFEQVRRLRGEGHEVMLATGRSWADTRPVAERLGLDSRFHISANGAMTLERDASAEGGYATRWIETFDPTEVLVSLRGALENAMFAVEDPQGVFKYSGHFPDGSFEARGQEVPFEQLLNAEATRLVVISPDHSIEEFTAVIERLGLHEVSYSVGWTAWLDIAPDGVNKGTALERVRRELGIPMERVVVAGDGRNDIEMLQWAANGGTAIAMGDAPQEVIDAGTVLAPDFAHDGLGVALSALR